MLRINKLIACAFLAYSTVSFSMTNDPLDLDNFSFNEPGSLEQVQKYTLWATYYYLHEVTEPTGTIPLRNMKGEEMGPRFTLRDWCYTAMEGSVKVNYKNGDMITYNYQGTTTDHYVDCKSIFPRHTGIGRTKYRVANGVYGDGLDDYILSPYRTLATDGKFIKPGTVLYIPEARGAKIKTPKGRTIIHDGYFFAADKGGAIKGNHVDVYIGVSEKASFFPWISSTESKTFNAYVISDPKIISDLLELHSQK